MDTFTLPDAEARLSELIDRVGSGETVAITRRGKLVARIEPAKRRQPVDVDALRAATANLAFDRRLHRIGLEARSEWELAVSHKVAVEAASAFAIKVRRGLLEPRWVRRRLQFQSRWRLYEQGDEQGCA